MNRYLKYIILTIFITILGYRIVLGDPESPFWKKQLSPQQEKEQNQIIDNVIKKNWPPPKKFKENILR